MPLHRTKSYSLSPHMLRFIYPSEVPQLSLTVPERRSRGTRECVCLTLVRTLHPLRSYVPQWHRGTQGASGIPTPDVLIWTIVGTLDSVIRRTGGSHCNLRSWKPGEGRHRICNHAHAHKSQFYEGLIMPGTEATPPHWRPIQRNRKQCIPGTRKKRE